MRPRKASVARHRVELDAPGDPVVQQAQRLADAKVKARLRLRAQVVPAAFCPGIIEACVEELVQSAVDHAIVGAVDERVGEAGGYCSDCRSNPDRVVAEA